MKSTDRSRVGGKMSSKSMSARTTVGIGATVTVVAPATDETLKPLLQQRFDPEKRTSIGNVSVQAEGEHEAYETEVHHSPKKKGQR